MRGKSLALLALALGCGLVASLGITQVMSKRDQGGAPAGGGQTVLVAVKEVPLGNVLSAQDVKLEEWPKDKLPAGALTRVEDIEGRRAKARLFPHDFILDQKLLSKDASVGGYDALIPKGYRVATVRVDSQSGGAGLLLPGSRVDLLVHVTRDPNKGFLETTTKTILEDLKVFAVNDVVSMDSSGPETKSIQARTVSLLVTPSQAEKITLANELGTIRLIMRPPEDDAKGNSKGATSNELLGVSEGSNREKDTPLLGQPGLPKPAKSGLNSVFDAMRAKSEKPALSMGILTPERPKHSFRLLRGAEVVDMELEQHETQADAGKGFTLWKAIGSAATAATAAARLNKEPADSGRMNAGPDAVTKNDPKASRQPPKNDLKPANNETKPGSGNSPPGTNEVKVTDSSRTN
jgi:pilus assembly protein CpaB